MALLQEQDRQYLKEEFGKFSNDVKINLFTSKSGCTYCNDTNAILQEVSELSDKIKLNVYDVDENKEEASKFNVERTPAVILEAEKNFVIFYGIPAGYEFSSLIEDIIDIGSGNTNFGDELVNFAKSLDKNVNLKVFVTTSCPYCPRAVRTAHKLSMLTDKVRGEMIEAQEFPVLSNTYSVSAVPRVVINENTYFEGALPDAQYIDKIKEALA